MISPEIIIIHDDWTEMTPVIVELGELFGKENVKLIKESQKGIDYILSTKTARKTIVLLDYNFKTGEPTGGDVFKNIRKKSSLIYVIIVTKSQYNKINADDLVEFINNHALAIARQSDGYSEIIELVKKAKHQLDVRADVIIEEWISSKNSEERKKPYIAMYDSVTYSLDDLLDNIRQQTNIGIKFEEEILELAIDLVMKKLGQKND